MSNLKTSTPANGFNIGTDSPAVDNIRRTFGIGDKVAELAPETSIFFSYLSKLGKKPIDETVWRPLEYRNQWQRRNLTATGIKATVNATTKAVSALADNGASDLSHVMFSVDYDKYGKVQKGTSFDVDGNGSGGTVEYNAFAPIWVVKGLIVRVLGVNYKIKEDAEILYTKRTAAATGTASTQEKAGTEVGYVLVAISDMIVVSSGSALAANAGAGVLTGQGQVNGSQWSEASGAPDGFRDELSSVEFFTQIFKTAVPLMSGSMMATKYRGYANEWSRIYAEHLKAHKMDMENAFLFGYGKYTDADTRSSWGLLPFLEGNGGKRYALDYDASTASSSDATYDVKGGFCMDVLIDVMDDFMSYESGNSGQKLCLTSRKVINSLHKVGDGSFLDNSFSGSNAQAIMQASVDVKGSSFMPVDITSIKTSYGSMNFVPHPLFRGDMADKAVCVDLGNVSYRPLAGNGVSRDTFVETNIQDNDIDGRKDQIITEAGLEIMLPETHAVIDFT